MANIVNGTATGSGGLITTGDSSDELQLQTAETTAVTIDSSQNVGIGTTTPGYFVEASRSQDTVTNLAVTNASTGTAAQTRLRLNNSGSNFGTITHTGGSFTTSGVFRQDGTYVYSNGAGGLTLVTGAAQPIYFAPNSTERVRIDSDGLKFNGDTAAANALDDYEEGTFTPSFAGFTVGNGSVFGRYTKIGNVVTVFYGFKFGSTSSITGVVRIANLPFTVVAVSTNVVFPVFGIAADVGTSFHSVSDAVFQNGVSSDAVIRIDGQSLVTSTNPFTWTTNDTLNLQVTYQTA